MDTLQLAAFEGIVREGGFGHAATALGISRAALDARIATLEAEIGGPLFARDGRQPALTERGTAFLPYARRALALLAEGQETARRFEDGERGRVTLGIIQSLVEALLTPIVTAFAAAHPRVELGVRVGRGDDVAQMVEDGAVQLGLLMWPTFNAAMIPLLRFRQSIVLVAAPGHALATGPLHTLAEVAALADPLHLLHWDGATAVLLDQLSPQATSVMKLPGLVTRDLVRRGVGAAFFLRALVAADLEDGALVEVPVSDLQPLSREGALIVARSETPLPATAQAFVATVRSHLRAAHLLTHDLLPEGEA